MRDGIIKQEGNSRYIKGQLPDTYEQFVQRVLEGSQGLDILFNPDGWSQLPTFLNKLSLLQDDTENALFGNVADRTVNDALLAIAQRFKLITEGTASLTLTVTDNNGLVVKNVLVQGMFSAIGGEVYTNDSGVASGYISAGNITVKVSGYADLVDGSATVASTAGGVYNASLTLTRRTFMKLTSSASYKFSGNVHTVDVSVGGAGGAGVTGSCGSGSARGGSGGGMGSVTTKTGITVNPYTTYAAIVGSGAKHSSGGSSSFLGVTAAGGVYGGGGRGALNRGYTTDYNGDNGAAGTQQVYSSMTATTTYGGAGGGGGAEYASYSDQSPGAGGAPGGGSGGVSSPTQGTDGLGGGGGGGGAWNRPSHDETYNYDGARGGHGIVAFRMHIT